MAEAAVSLVIQNLIPLLLHEANFLKGIHKEVTRIKSELESIQSFLKDADDRAEKEGFSDGVKSWVNQLREVAYQIEDVIDKYVLYMAVHRQCCRWPRFTDSLGATLCWAVNMKPHTEMTRQVKHIKKAILEIKERGKYYGFSSPEGSTKSSRSDSFKDLRITSQFIEEAEVVGIELHRDRLIDCLVKGSSKRTVISIVGMGGLGKTTLARKVYENQTVTTHFNNQAWITVSQTYKVEELLRNTIKQFYRARKESPPAEIDKMDETLLVLELQQYLKKKRYMVVFDDVWTVEFWALIRHSLPDNGLGSRVLITTRSDDVASSCKESSLDKAYKLQPLPEEKAFELFSKKVFHSDNEDDCPHELRDLSRNIVKRCEGLPLAIVAIGGMLSMKRLDVREWKKIEHTLGSELQTNPHLSNMTSILSLSFQDLPSYLRMCLLYFGMFPEDFSIRHARLIRLWIAEGFVKGTRGKTEEHVAQEYLTQLINRSLVQVSHVDTDGKVRLCRVHDLMREIILSKSEELSYGNVWTEDSLNHNGKTRRLAIHRSTREDLLKGSRDFEVRSVSVFDNDELPSPFLGKIVKVFKLLRVLDLQEAPMTSLPEEVGDLFHLRYLSVRHTRTKMLPKSVIKLHNLQTLDLKCSLVHELPTGIKRLNKLQYLLGYCYDYEDDFSIRAQRGLKLKDAIGCLEGLLKLYLVEANGVNMIKELRKLRKLRKLGITKLHRQNGRILCDSIASLNYLESLEICSVNEDETLDLQFTSSLPPHLQRLYLKGRLETVPDWIPKLQNLTTVSLMWSKLLVNPLEFIQHLPHLSELVLQQAYLGEELVFQAVGFKKLKILKLYDMNNLTTLTIEEGALPILALLKIGPVPRMKTVPSGIRNLRNLASLRFYDVPKEFAVRLLPNEGQDYWIVEHVRTVLFHYQLQGERYRTCTVSDLVLLKN